MVTSHIGTPGPDEQAADRHGPARNAHRVSRNRNVRIERTRRAALGLLSIFVLANIACQQPDPVAAFISKQDALPPEQRVPDWDRTKRLMLRKAPAVGDIAPDFSLATLDGSRTLKMSELHASRPLVLVFGSFT